MSDKTILVLDDEADILELIAVTLQKNGFEARCFEWVDAFWAYLKTSTPALIVLDLMLNDASGFDICRQLKADTRYAQIPVIMLTARSEEMEKVVGLELGADDYITKPFSPRELVARIKAVLRRADSTPKPSEANILTINSILQIDLDRHQVTLNGKILDLTQTEYKLLKKLTEKRGWVYSRDQLLDYLWGNDKIVIDRTIDVHIKNLREKLGECGDLIKNVRGVGYKISE